MPEVSVQADVALLLAELRGRFTDQLAARIDGLRAPLQRLVRQGCEVPELESLHREVHGLTGAAGTFGLPKVSEAARTLENLLGPLARAEGVCNPALALALADALTQLERAATGSVTDEPIALPPIALPRAAPSDPVVYWLQADTAMPGDLQAGLSEAGYRVQGFTNLAALESACNALPQAAALVLDLATLETVAPALALVQGLGAGRPPVLAALPSDDLAGRLGASRAGVHRTLSRPLDAARLVDMLDMLTGRQPPQPYRVLLVDDDPLLLEAQAAVLRAAGMVVHSLAQPLQTLDELQRFRPDVLLLDVYMPEASGPELAAALREREDWLDLPVLFLSAETDLTQQLLALNLGGDDFLVKPVQPDHLVAAVTARARRARQNTALRERLQTALYEREREHLALDQHAIVSVADGGGRITYANDLFCQVSGYPRTELLGRNHRLVVSDVHEPDFVDAIWRSIESGKVWRGEMCCRRKDGSLYWAESTVTPFLDASGAVYQYTMIQTDISHIKAVEAALRTQRDMQRVISVAAARLMAAPGNETSNAIDAALRDSGTQLGADRAYLFRFSKDGTSMTNTNAWQAEGTAEMTNRMENMPIETTPWMREQFLRLGRVVVQDVDQMPSEALADQGELRARGLRSLVVFPLLKGHLPVGFIGYSVLREGTRSAQRAWTSEELDLLKVLSDVVASALARNIAESQLRKSEARLHFLVSSSPVAIYTRSVNQSLALSYVSPNIQQLVGLEASTLTDDARQGLSLVHPDDVERVSNELPAVLVHGTDLFEYRMRCADGHYRWVQDQRRLVRDSAGAPLEIIGCWMDITERKRFETELSAFNQELEQRVADQTRSVIESEQLAQATLDALSARVVILDAQGDIVAANQAWRDFGGGRSPRDIHNYLGYCESGGSTGDSSILRPLAQGIREVINGTAPNFLYEYSWSIAGEVHWYVCRVERFGGSGDPRTVVSHEDITHMKLAERQQLRSQRLESLGTLAGGVAHDLNNALAPVLMGMSILKEQYPQESKLFDMMQGSAQRGADMVRQLLTFARGAEGERVSVYPASVVHELERLMKGSFPKNIQLLVHRDEVLPAVIGDPTQIHQVLLNLCVNARDAMPDGGTLSVRAQAVELDALYARSIPDAVPGSYLAVRVSDTGTGIQPDILDRIFDPFFTTKDTDKGTGLGLSTVLGIVKSHGGFVQVYSQLGKGTVFTVYLPAATVAPESADTEPAESWGDAGQGHGETILFVDDEAPVREVGRTVLERLNYTALVATDGADGLVQAAQHRGVLRAVITDLHMPHMDGLAFVRALRRTLPNVPVMVASGRVDEAVAAELLRHGVTRRIDKPFTQDQLARELKSVLSA